MADHFSGSPLMVLFLALSWWNFWPRSGTTAGPFDLNGGDRLHAGDATPAAWFHHSSRTPPVVTKCAEVVSKDTLPRQRCGFDPYGVKHLFGSGEPDRASGHAGASAKPTSRSSRERRTVTEMSGLLIRSPSPTHSKSSSLFRGLTWFNSQRPDDPCDHSP